MQGIPWENERILEILGGGAPRTFAENDLNLSLSME